MQLGAPRMKTSVDLRQFIYLMKSRTCNPLMDLKSRFHVVRFIVVVVVVVQLSVVVVVVLLLYFDAYMYIIMQVFWGIGVDVFSLYCLIDLTA